VPAVPIANLFYALNRLSLREQVPVSALGGASPSELLAAALLSEALRLHLRGVPRAYRLRGEDTGSPRGRLVVGETVGRALLARGRVHCEISELTTDIPFNRAVKAGLRALAADERVSAPRRRALRRRAVGFGEVSDVRLTRGALREATQGRAEPLHRSLLALLELVLLGLPRRDPDGRGRLPDFAGSLYAQVERPLDLRCTINGIPLRVQTLDLNRPWPAIHASLLGLVSSLPGA